MENYKPPFSITNRMLEYVSEIMEKIGKIDNYKNFEKMPNLRRNNKIKSIHSSLAIEANSLSLDETKAVIDGKLVLGPEKEIQEVLNAYEAYEMIGSFDPYSIDDLKKIHGVMTKNLVSISGNFRTGNEGVRDGATGNIVHVCPPPEQVSILMHQLFDWMKDNKDEVHPLILSSVFHYEFVFIHPFQDGNGRMSRIWQNALLTEWKDFFEYLPIESELKKYQSEYYAAIDESNKNANPNAFIEFMLRMINSVLDELIETSKMPLDIDSINIERLLNVMDINEALSAFEIMERLKIKSKETLRNVYLKPAIKEGLVKLTIPEKPNSKNQRYYKVSK